MKTRALRIVSLALALALLLSIGLAIAASALPMIPLYPPGPPYSRLGPGGTAPNFWSASGQGNPQFFMSGNFFWWQNPPPPATTMPPPP